MAKIPQVRVDVNTMLGYSPSNQNAYAAARAFINGRVDLASPKAITDFIRENVVDAKAFVDARLSKSAPKKTPEPKTTLTTSPTPSESNSIEPREQVKPVRGGKGKVRPRSENYVTGSHVERNVDYGRIKLNTGALLSLEPEVIKAIEFLDPSMDSKKSIKSSKWCDDAVSSWTGASLNNAAIIRCSVINELLARVQP